LWGQYIYAFSTLVLKRICFDIDSYHYRYANESSCGTYSLRHCLISFSWNHRRETTHYINNLTTSISWLLPSDIFLSAYILISPLRQCEKTPCHSLPAFVFVPSTTKNKSIVFSTFTYQLHKFKFIFSFVITSRSWIRSERLGTVRLTCTWRKFVSFDFHLIRKNV